MKLRVLHVDPERGFSGGETQVLALATHLRDAGHEILVAAHPGGGSRVFVANARTGTIQMLDGETLALLREARGPVDVRAVAWEPRREVLLAMGRISRQLAAVDLRLGRTVKASALAAVPRAMVLDFQHDRVLVGGDRGLLAVDLTRWLYPAPAAGAR